MNMVTICGVKGNRNLRPLQIYVLYSCTNYPSKPHTQILMDHKVTLIFSKYWYNTGKYVKSYTRNIHNVGSIESEPSNKSKNVRIILIRINFGSHTDFFTRMVTLISRQTTKLVHYRQNCHIVHQEYGNELRGGFRRSLCVSLIAFQLKI